MTQMRWRSVGLAALLCIVTVAALGLSSTVATAAEFFFDDFESYADDGALGKAWVIEDINVTETGTTWTMTNPSSGATRPGPWGAFWIGSGFLVTAASKWLRPSSFASAWKRTLGSRRSWISP